MLLIHQKHLIVDVNVQYVIQVMIYVKVKESMMVKVFVVAMIEQLQDWDLEEEQNVLNWHCFYLIVASLKHHPSDT